MAGNSFGEVFRITTFGESHGAGIGVVVDGCPPGVPITTSMLSSELARRRPGQSELTSPRNERDAAILQSGVLNDRTTGAPVMIWIPNEDTRPGDYHEMADAYRPSHADYTYQVKYGVRDPSGGGRSSARETAARVAGGVLARALISHYGISVTAFVTQVHTVKLEKPWTTLDLSLIESNAVRCPDPVAAELMSQAILEAKAQGDSLGGVITCLIRGCPAGLGEPVFDRLHADLGKAILSINACKGFDLGSGFSGVEMKGSEHNDSFDTDAEGHIMTTTNRSGGIQGGISNGMPIVFRAAFKPTSTILKPQKTVSTSGEKTELAARGRHDPCVLPRAVPIVEAMAALTLADHLLKFRASRPIGQDPS